MKHSLWLLHMSLDLHETCSKQPSMPGLPKHSMWEKIWTWEHHEVRLDCFSAVIKEYEPFNIICKSKDIWNSWLRVFFSFLFFFLFVCVCQLLHSIERRTMCENLNYAWFWIEEHWVVLAKNIALFWANLGSKSNIGQFLFHSNI